MDDDKWSPADTDITPWWVAGAGGQTVIIWTLMIIIYQLQKCVGNMVLHMVHTGRSKGVRKGHI